MIYILRNNEKRIDIMLNHVVTMERRKNAPTIDDERVTLVMTGGSSYVLYGQDAKDFFDDWRTLIVPVLGGTV